MTEQQRSAQVFASHIEQFFNNKETYYQKISLAEYKAWKQQFTWECLARHAICPEFLQSFWNNR